MAGRYMPKTLAKTISYMVYHSPGKFGLFWDPDGSMPWKELYWALQEDPHLRYVRESHIRELSLLGIDIPVTLEGNALHLQKGLPAPAYPACERVPARLFHACRRKHYPFVLKHGLQAQHRPFLAISSDRDLAILIGKRRDPEPLLIEILALEASADGIIFRDAGSELYLVESIPLERLLIPPLREEKLLTFTSRKNKTKKASAETPAEPLSPGSFFVNPSMYSRRTTQGGRESAGGQRKKGGRGPQWKREARKDRRKRS